jgi:hypothetical protein
MFAAACGGRHSAQQSSVGVSKVNLTVVLDGHGSVRSAPSGIDCGSTCSATFDAGTSIALAATPDSGWVFAGWSDGCSGAGGCALTLNGDTRVTAKFTGPPPVTTLASSDGTNIGHFGLNSSRVFYDRSGINVTGIWSVPKTGGAASLVVSLVSAYYIVADEDFVYWTDSRSVFRAPASGGAAQQLYQPTAVYTLALDGGNLYFVSYSNNGGILVGPAGGGSLTRLGGINPTGGLAVDAQHVYWTDRLGENTNGVIMRVTKGGGAAETVVACGACVPRVVRLDSQNLYYRNSDSDVWSRAKSGGDLRLLSTGNPRAIQGFGPDLDVNGSVAYWMFNYGDSSQARGLFRANSDGSGWGAIDTAPDDSWIGPRVDASAIFYFHAGALLRRNK